MNVSDITAFYEDLLKQPSYAEGILMSTPFLGNHPIRIVIYDNEYCLLSKEKPDNKSFDIAIGYLQKTEASEQRVPNTFRLSLNNEHYLFTFHSNTSAARRIYDYINGQPVLRDAFYFVNGQLMAKEQFENKLALKQKTTSIE